MLSFLLAACAGPKKPAPVEERRAAAPPPAAAASAAPAETPPVPPAPLPGAENAGKPGYYTVKPGDTLMRIALDHGQGWRDIARWNALDNPNRVEVGQVLRVVPPEVEVAARAVPGNGRVESRPLEARPPAAPPAPAAAAPAPPSGPAVSAPVMPVPAVPAVVASAPAAPATTAPAVPAAAAPAEEEQIAWSWPAGGAVLAGFDEGRNKGLTIGGNAGDPVLAAANGRVMYVGSSIRGYGNLIIVKHNDLYLSAYAHNQQTLVKEDQVVRRGQRIADMGSSDAQRVQLHFEIRRQGKPVDPAKLLPPR
jgi:lipoprotein NlpD